jgi:hypothetical protein
MQEQEGDNDLQGEQPDWVSGMLDPVLTPSTSRDYTEADRMGDDSDLETLSETDTDDMDYSDTVEDDMDDTPFTGGCCTVKHSGDCTKECALCNIYLNLTWSSKRPLKCTVTRLDFVRFAPDSQGFRVQQETSSRVICGSCLLLDGYLTGDIQLSWETIIKKPPWRVDVQTMLDAAISCAVRNDASVTVPKFIQDHVHHSEKLIAYANVDACRLGCMTVMVEAIHRVFKEHLSLN